MSGSDICPLNVLEDLHRLLDEGEMSDITFEIEGQTFAAHRLILAARLLVFKAELLDSLTESNIFGSIMIKDMRPDLLEYICTNSVPKISDKKAETVTAQHLLVAAEHYELEGLKLICESKLLDDISLDKVTTTLALAVRYNCAWLKDACLDFVAVPNNIVSLMLNKEYIKLLHDSPYLLDEIQAKICLKKPKLEERDAVHDKALVLGFSLLLLPPLMAVFCVEGV